MLTAGHSRYFCKDEGSGAEAGKVVNLIYLSVMFTLGHQLDHTTTEVPGTH